MNRNLGVIVPARLEGKEKLHKVGIPTEHSVLDFWQWSGSDLISNTFRGLLAEYIVATDIGITDGIRQAWEAYDLLTPEGIRVEVKTSAYIQNWHQKKLSIPRFSIRRAFVWDAKTNTYSDMASRHSDVYVFCLHNHRDQLTIDPLDVTQWVFWVLLTSNLEALGEQKTIGLSVIQNMDSIEISYGQIYQTIQVAVGKKEIT